MTREEAIKIISQMIKDEEGFLSDNTVEAHKMAIKALEQKPKTGHWIDIDEEPHEDWECDRCGHIEYANEDLPDKYHFCPNCGAKMVEPQESEAQSADSN